MRFLVLTLAVSAAFASLLIGVSPKLDLVEHHQVNSSHVQAFIETFFSHNQLVADTSGNLCVGFSGISKGQKDTDVFFSRFVRAEKRWTPSLPISSTTDLDRAVTLWIDSKSNVLHYAWVRHRENKTQRQISLSYRRSQDGGITWSPEHEFPVGITAKRRPELGGDGSGNLYLFTSNSWTGEQERIHLFQSGDGGQNWAALDVNYGDSKKGGTSDPQLAIGGEGEAYLVWLDPTPGGRAVVLSHTRDGKTWSAPIPLNDDLKRNFADPRVVAYGDVVYVTWLERRGRTTALYFDYSEDGGESWHEDQVIFDKPVTAVVTSTKLLDGALLIGWSEFRERFRETGERLQYRVYTSGKGWSSPGKRASLFANTEQPGQYFGFDILPWGERESVLAYSKVLPSGQPQIFLAWSSDPDLGFSTVTTVSDPKRHIEGLSPRLVAVTNKEIAVLYNERQAPLLPQQTGLLGDLVVARIRIR